MSHKPSPLDLIRPAVRAMPGYTPGEQVADLTKLNTNEGAYPPSPRVMAAIAALTPDNLRLYPDPVSTRLRTTAAALFGLKPEQVLAGNGSDDCLTILYRGFLDAGERVACPWPTYGLYDTLAALQGAELVRVPFVVNGRRFTLPPALTQQRAKMIILANPNNPTGTMIPVAELRALCQAAPDAIVVVDEAYIDFALVAGLDASVLPVLDQHPNLIVLRTLSKAYSLAGARIGLLFAAAPIVEMLTKVKDSYNLNAVSQAIGVAALEDRVYWQDCVRRTLEERRRLEVGLDELGLTWPDSGANFLMVEAGARAEPIYRALKSQGILVRWWSAPELRTQLRISVGKPADTDRLLALLKSLL